MSGQPKSGRKTHLPRGAATGGRRRTSRGSRQPPDRFPGLGAVGLVLVEDGLGQRTARCWPLAPRPGSRIYEISSTEGWTELVGRYPIDVSKFRLHDWWRTTGWAGRWLIPDFAAVAADYDAVHLSVAT